MGINLTHAISSWFSSSSTTAQCPSSSSSLTPSDTIPSASSSPILLDDEHPDDYGYGLSPVSFNALLTTEYPSLHSSELVHLDHAASPPPPISAISSLTSCLSATLYSNPHSHSLTEREIDRMRSRVMQVLFGLGEREQEGWDLVWTSGASASLKLVGEHFPWCPGVRYRYLKESHTSLVGIRACALAAGACVEALDLDAFLSSSDEGGYALHGYPAQCNVTGSRLGLHPARTLSRRTRKNEAVLVDAAAYLSTSPLDLSKIPYEEAPDFVVGSLYKIYGHPTGLGFLLLKRSSAHFVTPSPKPTYFGGRTIDALSVSSPYWVHPRGSKEARAGLVHERFENGTIPYLSVVALRCAMDAHEKLFTPKISSASYDPTASLRAVGRHAQYLADLTRTEIKDLKHWDSSPLTKIHTGEGTVRWEKDGPTIALTLYTPSSQGSRPIGHAHLLNLATLANIQLRTGGMCNTGVLARVSKLSDQELEELWETGRVCGDGQEFGGVTGDKPLGLARISFGACSSVEDVRKFVQFLKRYFLTSREVVEMLNAQSIIETKPEDRGAYLQNLVRYPIKSCGGQSLTSSRLTSTGLLHDREFMLINSATRKTMSQKEFPQMVLIKPSIDDDYAPEVMRVRAEGMPDLIVPMRESQGQGTQVTMCSDVVAFCRMSVEADEWFSKFLGVSCQLHRFVHFSSSSSSCSTGLSTSDDTPAAPILFSNESPFTLISTSSVNAVNDWITSDNRDAEPSESQPIYPSCFRANFTISSPVSSRLPPFHEDTLTHISIGAQTFQVLTRCRRCLMICVDQETGMRMREPFCCLARHRRNGRRRVEFGVHLMWRAELSGGRAEEAKIRVGDRIAWTVE